MANTNSHSLLHQLGVLLTRVPQAYAIPLRTGCCATKDETTIEEDSEKYFWWVFVHCGQFFVGNLCQLPAQCPVQNLTTCCRPTVAHFMHFMTLSSLRTDRYCMQFRIRSCSLAGRRKTASTHRSVHYVARRFLAEQLRNRWHATYFEGKG